MAGRAWIRWVAVAGAVLVGAMASIYAWPAARWLRSEAVLDRRYTLPRSLIEADSTPKTIARGARLVRLAGCTGCHGADLKGKLLRDPVTIFASNLRAAILSWSDEDFD